MKKKLYREIWPKILPSQNLLYWLCAILFFIEMGRVLLAFFKIEPLGSRLASLPYVFCLLLYVLRKCIGHLGKKLDKKRKGHVFVLIWVVFVLCLLAVQTVSRGRYRIPALAVENLIFIVSVFAGRNISKIMKRIKAKGTQFLRPYVILVFFGRKAMQAYCRRQARLKKERKRKTPPRHGNKKRGILCTYSRPIGEGK